MFADLHNHNHSRTYLWLRPWMKKHERKGAFHPWTVIASNMRARKKGGMASAYGQSDLVKLWNGKVRLTFNALYPIEKGFFKSTVFKTKNDPKRAIIGFASHHDLPLRDLLQGFVMRLPQPMINHIQSDAYDYWEALNEEYRFLLTKNGQLTRNRIQMPGLIRSILESKRKRRRRFPRLLNANGAYQIPTNKAELEQLLAENKIVMILTIEGMHAIGTDTSSPDQWKKRVDHIKKQWQHPVFFITFAHHFDNKLCGHAHSFPDIAAKKVPLLDQRERLNGSFTPEGRLIIRKLLSLDAQNNPKPSEGYRILIDVKHMSALSRKEYYNEIVRPCLQKGDIIPVIASHCGYSGRSTLDELIIKRNEEKDDYFANGPFYAWNINVCDEDIRMIFDTEGLFGLSFDQRIVGVPSKQKKEGGLNTLESLWNNLEAVVKVIFNANDIPENQKPKIWERLTLGSDFEGYIDPVNPYPTALEYDKFKTDLIALMEEKRKSNGNPLFGLKTKTSIEKVVEKLCFENAGNFVRKWYRN